MFTLRADPIDFAGFLFVLADGMVIRRLSEPELSLEPLLEQAIGAAGRWWPDYLSWSSGGEVESRSGGP